MVNDAHLDLAGFRQLNGDMGSQVPTGFVLVPGVIKLDGEALVWELAGPAKAVRPGPGMLEEFLRLAKAPPAAFLRYARKWGVLSLDERGRPCRLGLNGRESLEDWKYFSRRARAVLNIAAYAKLDRLAPPEHWKSLVSLALWDRAASAAEIKDEFDSLTHGLPIYPPPEKMVRPGRSRVEVVRQVIENEINAWLKLHSADQGSRPPDFAVHWNHRVANWELQIDHHGFLFRALAFQLALVASGAHGFYCCTGCGTPYLRTKDAPRRGEANFCEQCGREEALRLADRRRRQKIAEACRLHAEGVPIKAIATRLDTKPKHVRNWIKRRGGKNGETRTR